MVEMRLKCGHMSNSSAQITPKASLVLVSTLPKLFPNPLALINLVVTAGPRQGFNPLVKLSHSMGVGAAGPAQAQLSC